MLETLAITRVEQSCIPKTKASIPQKQADFVFGRCFWGNWQSVPMGEDCKHEEEELQGTM